MTATTMRAPAAARTERGPAWIGRIAAVLMVVPPAMSFFGQPTVNGPDGMRRLGEHLADRGNATTGAIAEPLAIAVGALLLWFVGRLVARVRAWDGGEPAGSIAMAAGIGFAALYVVAGIAQTTVAGSIVFASSFEPDPHTAFLFGHLAYVALGAALIAAAVMVWTAAGAAQRAGVVSDRFARASRVVAALCVPGFMFTILPLVLVATWVAVVAGRIARGTL